MKNILLLATGGTIVSVEKGQGLTPELTSEELINYLPIDKNFKIESKQLLNLDSSNILPEHWIQLAEAIQKNYDAYDSFIITHGTDTMAYTAAALSYMITNLGKPVILTGSQVPIHYSKTDARKNLLQAYKMACEDVSGVYVVFDGRIINGKNAVKMRTKSYDAFESINAPYIAFIEDDSVHYLGTQPKRNNKPLQLNTELCSNIFILKLYPGIDPIIFHYIKNHYNGVIIEAFGSGGIPFLKKNIAAEINKLIELGIAVVITTQCLEEGIHLSLYETGKKLDENKVILGKDFNTEALVPKLMIALGKTKNLKEIKQLMESNDMFTSSSIQKNRRLAIY
ncbi:asparaginase [Bacillus taeanensis]|uniref:L-asparaginase 1 n=1 Tax=Bacillus taeanensis TaxID=273032 RepID=A0A366XVU7_9BACI|nr:asparaginase [Bacillus taeanensis]RBW68061.1 L-asparaginase 1 [Bacillus taeanensis]